MRRGVLYISYDGMLEPLGQSQVLAYLEHLAKDQSIHLISFEKAADWDNQDARKRIEERIEAAGIVWHPRRYHKRPSALATAWDILIGYLSGLWVMWRHRLRIVHARSYVPAVMALLLKMSVSRAKFVFDMRGFWADERVDGALWPRDGYMFRTAKWFERRFMLSADHVVALTHAAKRELMRFRYRDAGIPRITVIPTCADLGKFSPAKNKGVSTGLVLGYVGSAGTWYLFDAVARAMRLLLDLRPDARFLLLNRGEHELILETLEMAGIPKEKVELRAADHSGVPEQMARMSAGIFFYRPSYSRLACAPTKLGEFLGCGIPCLSNHGVGDMGEILEGGRVGAAVSSFDDESLLSGLKRLLSLLDDSDISVRCVAEARRNFSLADGVKRYQVIYDSVGDPG